MNPYPVYSHIKRMVQHSGKFPTTKEIVKTFPTATVEEIREGTIEAELAYERDWKHNIVPISTTLINDLKKDRDDAVRNGDLAKLADLGLSVISHKR